MTVATPPALPAPPIQGLRPHLVLLGLAAVATVLLGKAIGFGLRVDLARVPVGGLAALIGALALAEVMVLRVLGVGSWRACALAGGANGFFTWLGLVLTAGWLSAQGDLLGWSLAVIVGLLFLLLLALTLLAAASCVRLAVLARCTRDPRAGWLAPLLTVAPLVLGFALWRMFA